MTQNEIEDRLLTFLHQELLPPDLKVDRDDELLTGEILDSLAAVRLSGFVEETFDFQIPPADLIVENFRSVAVIAEYVLRMRKA